MAIKGVLNILAGYDNLGNPVYASIYPKSTIDQIENLAQHIEDRIDTKISEIPLTAKDINGTIKKVQTQSITGFVLKQSIYKNKIKYKKMGSKILNF